MRIVEFWALSYFVNSLWQVPLVFAAGWVAAQWARRVSAELEHKVWVGALLLEAVLPGCFGLPADWWRTLIDWGREARRIGDAQVSVVMGAGTAVGTMGLPDWFLTLVSLAYVAMVGYFSARFAWRWRKLRELRSDAVEVTLHGEAERCWRDCESRFGVGRLSLASSFVIRGPVAFGISKKLVLVPLDMIASLPREDLYTVIAHEFAHLRRRDFLKNLIYELVSLLVSYHPLAWLTRQRVKESREAVCDAMAAGIPGAGVEGRREYARSLLRLASLVLEGGRNGQSSGIAIGMFDANVFERRVMRLTEEQHEVRGFRRWMVLVGCAALAITCCGTALALSMQVNAGAGAAKAVSGAGTASGTGVGALKVPSGEMSGNRISGSNPKYPADAKKAGIQGTVVLSAVISKQGEVENLRVVSGPKELQQSSLDAVKDWKYKPYILNGDPVEVETTINVTYSLAG